MPRNNYINFRRGTYTQWDAQATGVLSSGEPGFITDFNKLKIGDGVTEWSDLTAVNDNITTMVINKTANTIPKMSVVYINGAQGDLPSITLSIASGESSSSKTYGLTVGAIAPDAVGQVVVDGALKNLNTLTQFSGVTPGTTLWLSPTVSGGITTSKPYAPYHMVSLGNLIRVHQNQGVINVSIQNGFELEELHNVATTGATNGQFLQYNNASGLWVPTSSGNFSTLGISGNLTVSSTGDINVLKINNFYHNNLATAISIDDNDLLIGIIDPTGTPSTEVITGSVLRNNLLNQPAVLRFRQGTEAERLLITPASGEPIWTTDSQKFYIGDGTTVGGDLIGPSPHIRGSGVQSITAANSGCSANGNYNVVGGGLNNVTNAIASTIGGGQNNAIGIDGSNATIGGGDSNTASNYWSVISGGRMNSVTEFYATVGGGNTNTSSGYGGVIAGGGQNTNSGYYSTIAGGKYNNSTGIHSVVGGGKTNTSSGQYSIIPGGMGAKTSRHGEFSHAAGGFSNAADAQHTILIARRETTNNTANQVLFLDNDSARLTLPAQTVWTFSIKISAYNSTDNQSGWWIIRGGIRRNNSNSTVLVGSLITESGFESSLSAASVSVVADDTNEALEIRVTGVSGRVIRWVAVVDISQVSFGTP